MRFFFRIVGTLALSTLVVAIPIPWQPVDIFLVVILGIAHTHGERAAMTIALLLGLVADVFGATPFGMLLVLYPLMLGALYLLGTYVITNRSVGSILAYAIVGTLIIHGGLYGGSALAAFLSRGHAAIDLASHIVRALLINTTVLVAWIYARNFLVRRYDSRFLRRNH